VVAGEVAAEEARKRKKTYLVASTPLPAPAAHVFAHDHPDASGPGMNVMFEFTPAGERIRGASALSHNQLAGPGIETRTRRPRLGIVPRSRASLLNKGSQLGKVLTAIVKVGKAIPSQNSFAGLIPFAPHGAAKGRPQPGKVRAILMETKALVPLIINGIGQIPPGRFAPGRVMAADKIQRADKTAVAAAIAKAAFDPTLALAEELQQQVQNFDGFCGVARVHDRCSRSVTRQPNTNGADAPQYAQFTAITAMPSIPIEPCRSRRKRPEIHPHI
jgi:hypothetical protein